MIEEDRDDALNKKKGIERLLQRRFEEIGEKVEKVIILPSDDGLFGIEYLDRNPEMSYYSGYVVVEGIQIPFIAEVWPDNTTHIYLDSHKDFYLAHLVADGPPALKDEGSTPTEVSLTVQAPLTGVVSLFSARRQLGAVHGSSSVRLAMHQHTPIYIPKYF